MRPSAPPAPTLEQGAVLQAPLPARAWSMAWGYAALLTIPCIFLLLFFLYPLVGVILRSFTEPSLGFDNYVRIFSRGPYLEVLWITFRTAATVTAACLLIAYPVAYVISQAEGARLRLYFALVLIPFWTSVVIRTYAWLVLFQRQGLINEALLSLGVVDEPVRFAPSSFGVHVGMVHVMLPFMILPLVASMRGIDRTLLRAAEVLGASPVMVFLKVFLPLSLPGITAGVTLVFITSLGFFVTPALLGGARAMMAAVLIEQQASVYLNWPLAAALATTLLLATTAIYMVYVRVAGRIGAFEGGR